jgi:predicted 3-demethylubiquinone-9 3-methyltransferase (glyoxalase superfamily)
MMQTMYNEKDEAKLDRVTKAFLQMKKFDIAKLEAAARGE